MSKNPIYEVSIGGGKAPYAEYHQDGTSKMPKRQIFPKGGKKFKKSIMDGITDVSKLAVESIVRRINKSSKLGLKDFLKEVNKQLDKKLPTVIKHQILRTMQRGESPAANINKFPVYSESYTKQIEKGKYSKYGKKTSPVNLKLSGALYESLEVKKKQ